MAFFEWDNSYSVNVAEIDKQHKQLIDLINKLNTAMGSGHGKDVVGGILEELINYTKSHFATEEKYMKHYNYPLTMGHKNEHDKLTKQVIDLHNEFKSGSMLLSVKVMNFLKDWLKTHILENDIKFGKFLNSVNVK